MGYVKKDTPWAECAYCTYCGAGAGLPCWDMNRSKGRFCLHPHITRTTIQQPHDKEPTMNHSTKSTDERLLELESGVLSIRMQLRATLKAVDSLSATVRGHQAALETVMSTLHKQNEALSLQRDSIDLLDARFKDSLHKAVQLVMAYDDEPTFEDYWEIDQANTDLNLMYRVES